MTKFLCLIFSALCAVFCGGHAVVGAPDTRSVPVIMYHSVCKTNVGEYVLHPDRLRADFEYIKKHGYTAVFVREIADFCEGKGSLPPRPIVLTFDDGFYNNLYYVAPLAAEYGMKITVSIVGAYSDKEQNERKRSPVYSYLSAKEIKKIHAGGLTELANHTYDMHSRSPRKGIRRLAGESPDEYRRALTSDSERCRKLIESASGQKVDVFTYPFGVYSDGAEETLSSLGYRAILTCKGGINVFRKGSTRELKNIMRYNRSGTADTESFFKSIKV